MFRKLIQTFSNTYLPERLLFLAVSGGMIFDGIISGSMYSLNDETVLRLAFSFFSAIAFLFTMAFRLSRPVVRWMAYVAIATLLSFAAFNAHTHSFAFDESLAYIGVYVICSLYFRTTGTLLFYLVAGLLMIYAFLYSVEQPHVDPSKFMLRMFLGSILVFGLSWATRLFQVRLVQLTEKVEEQNQSLSETTKVLEERLTRDHLLSMVASRTNAIVMISDAEDNVEWVNQEFTNITGYTPEEIRGKKPDFLRGKDTSADTVREIQEKKNAGESFRGEILNYRKDGTPIWLLMHVTPLQDDDGVIQHFVSIQEDITEIKRNESDLRKSRELLRKAQQQAKLGSWEWVAGNEYINCSGEMCKILGLPEAGMIPVPDVLRTILPADLPVVQKSIQNIIRRHSPFELDCRVIAGGVMKFIYITGQPSDSNDGSIAGLIGTVQDITERKQIEQELMLAEKQYRSLFEYSQHMICIHDLQGKVRSINPSGAHTLGYEPEELIGRFIHEMIPSRFRREYDHYLQLIQTEGMHSGLVRMTKRNGQEGVWLYSNIRLTDHQGNPFVLSSNVEITDRYLIERELRSAKKTAEDALVAKDRFVANISHELRTPLNAIAGFSELLSNTDLEPEQKEYARAISVATENLTSMINDILDLAKIEAGKIEFERRIFNVREVISKVHLLLSPKAAQTGIRFTWHCDEKVPLLVVSDDLRLTQILMNVVGNAVKFTEKGFVSVHCFLQDDTEQSLKLRFVVEDSGIGIPRERLESIFDPFSQASAFSTRRYGGTGLGLTIVRDLVELQDGTITVQSAEGLGSRFEIVLPAEKINEDAVQQVDVALTSIEHPGEVSVLLVEDHPLNQQLASRLIRDFGFHVSLASNGRIAVDMLRSESFDVILMDLQMPEVDGYEATAVIRKRLKLNTPIIALTAHSSAGEREKCLELGMNDYMTKPYRSRDLYYVISKAIRREVKELEPEDSNDVHPLHALSGGDKLFEKEILETMLQSFPEEFNQLRAAADSLHYTRIKEVCHRLKSSVALAGNKLLSSQLSDAESLAAQGRIEVKELCEKIISASDPLMANIREMLSALK